MAVTHTNVPGLGSRLLAVIDWISEWSGRLIAWLMLALVLLLGFEVFMRYLLSKPTNFSYEVACMLGVAFLTIGLAYTHLHDGHVRVDVLWRLLPKRRQKIVDIIGALLFFFPLVGLLTYAAFRWTVFAYEIGEVFMETTLYPAAWPTRAAMTLGLLLFLLQGIAKLARDVLELSGKEADR